ncbi:MAG: hypothetical protein CEN91_267 [Candidatus Berkelbacteria bacterium Licking1014_85]|uniref:Uncharacterized protein n=1 Tax=Candidatus Berkelbacteria bacterium Licking1014_85 TaxID=2017148 RepID=A0A554LK87_9BACT|nr:MAG: hypothetical protein CEN91_267 [Candidatus Berkelbacteria bacterium Licking1014_85]
MRLFKYELIGIKLTLAIISLVIVFGSSVTAMAFELKDGSVSRFIANIGSKSENKIISPNQIQTTALVLEDQAESQPETTSSTSAPTTATAKTKKGSINRQSSSSSNSSSSSSNDTGSSGNSNSDSSSNSSGSSGTSATTAQATTTTTTAASSVFGNFNSTSIESIVNALSLVFDDATGDYTEPGGGGPPEGVYDYAPIDQDNWYMGVRDGRLYIKLSLGGALPTSQQTENGNNILSDVYNIRIDSDDNRTDSCQGAETHLQINVAYHDDGQIWYNPWFSANCLSGEGEHDATYEKTGNGMAHTYNSGIGKSSIVWSYALSDLAGTVTAGNTLHIDFSSEAEGSVYHHYSYDQNSAPGGGIDWISWAVAEI